MPSKARYYFTHAVGIVLTLFGIWFVSEITPAPIEPTWKYYLPPTLPGILILLGLVVVTVNELLFRRENREPRYTS